VLAGVTQTLVAQRRDRREHADRLPVRLTTTRHAAEATSPPPDPTTRSSQFAANGIAPALLAISGVSWLYPGKSYVSTEKNIVDVYRRISTFF